MPPPDDTFLRSAHGQTAWLAIADVPLVALGLAVSLSSLALILGFDGAVRGGGPAILMLSAMLAAAVCGRTVRGAAVGLLAVLALAALCLALASRLIDVSYDGQEYHFDATYALAHGWNPYHAALDAFVPPGAPVLPWPQHYPIGAWLLQAMAWTLGVPFAAAKGMLWLPTAVVAPIWLRVLRDEGLDWPASIVLALTAAASPVALAQLGSAYVDGFVGSLAACFIGLAVIALRCGDWRAMLSALACLGLAVDTKFNAIPIFGAATASICVILLLRRQAAIALRFGALCLATLSLVVLTIGFHPYVGNTLDHGNPFYPVMGAPEYEVNSALLPPELKRLPDIALFMGTTFSAVGQPPGTLVPPFAPQDLSRYGYPDASIGGWGPLFSGALVLALVLIAVLIARRSAQASQSAQGALVIAAGLVLSAVVTPYMWWPRFVPQLWLALLLIAAAGILSMPRAARWIGWACAIVLLANSALMTVASARAARLVTQQAKAHIAMVLARDAPYCAAFGAAHGRIQALRDAGAVVVPLPDRLPLACARPETIPHAYDFLWHTAASCGCAGVDLGTARRWVPPPDRTLEDIRTMRERGR